MTAEHRVAVLALDRVIPLDFAQPVQVFGDSAGLPYRLRVCAPNPVVQTTSGFTIGADAGLEALAEADTVVVPGYRPHDAELAPAVLDALRAAHARGARMVSICVGAFALAAAGLLDGRPATTHWHHAGDLARMHPRVRVDPAVLYVDDGDVLTSAGVSAGMDLCLHLVRRDCGVDAARRRARDMVAAPHREGNQAQFAQGPGEAPGAADGDAGDGPIGELRAWLRADPARDVDLAEMAARASMSVRTLNRRFREVTGTAPVQWLLAARMDEARRLLETTDDSVEQVARRAGFGTALNLRIHFRRRLDSTPTAYRRAFVASAAAHTAPPDAEPT